MPCLVTKDLANLILRLLVVDAQPKEEEKPMYDEVSELLERAAPILEEMKKYEGAGNEIRQVCLHA